MGVLSCALSNEVVGSKKGYLGLKEAFLRARAMRQNKVSRGNVFK